MNKKTIIITSGIVIVVGIIVSLFYTAGYRQNAPPTNVVAKGPASDTLDRTIRNAPAEMTAKIYVMKVQENNPILVPIDIKVSVDDNPIKEVLLELIEFQGNDDLVSLIPEGTELLDVGIKGDTAIINFGGSFVDGFAGGADEEGLLVKSIVKTVSQFGNVKQIRMLCNGVPVTTFGHLEIEDPINVEDFR